MTGPRLQRRRRLRILPSATTLIAICAGLTSIKFALDSRPHVALALIGAAAVLDGIDGGIARASIPYAISSSTRSVTNEAAGFCWT